MTGSVRPLSLAGLPARAAAAAMVDDARVVTDEERARMARDAYRERGVPAIDADADVAPHLVGHERVLGGREAASLTRIDERAQGPVREDGRLYVTSERLLHLGRRVTSVALADISELAMADDRILVTIRGGRGLMLDVPEPRQFRVLLAAARSAA